ncbi:uncharacterized protein Z520_00916 [Fonsecaea multimorphosa CBS 102226]|uniref:Phenazine biosynthesis protein n=1 Tax=Fonsecaea multimorphosa CBS 102226 TaxID=1442371 RepID=A0A0D2J440_9EURO|nr:uncharacterized protein Z520_00916 [Fonsecaea multimorphosa CBS 102226]KIY04222.1 hypothetical protein Z520_00916 [Fonsecaea multimorphosa CBS 102226]OAL32048.1 hypothetical protein AYO22_00918 [Fonsecaea multimorphosa]
MSTQLSFVTLDVFTSTRYTGNPLALVKVPQHVALSQSQKQRIAREFNLSETVFLHEPTTQADVDDNDNPQTARVDIFTAQAELPFAGHPTVGAANYLLRLLGGDDNLAASKRVTALQTKAGRIPISLNPAGDGCQISVAHNLHVHASPYGGKPFGHYPVVSIVKGMTFILAQLPDLAALATTATENLIGADATYTSSARDLDVGWREGMVVTYFFVDQADQSGPHLSGGGARTIRTRCFAEREDPATGSAACALASYLSLQTGKAGRYRYAIVQGVEMGQRSELYVEIAVKDAAGDGDGRLEIEEVLLSGSAVQVMQGTLEIPAPEEA